jgi:CRISPR-associated protein Cas1
MKGCRIFFCRSLHQLLEDLEGRSPVQGFAGPVVEQVGHGIEGLLIMHRQVGALGQHLAQQVMQPRWCAAWAQGIVHAKINRQARVLARWRQDRPDARLALTRAERGVATVREALAVLHADSGDTFVRLATLRGLEGTAARAHFAGLAAVLPPALGFTGRNRRPPRDPANACLSLGYTLLHAEAVTAAQAAGLDPLLGFYHRPAFGCESLASDL